MFARRSASSSAALVVTIASTWMGSLTMPSTAFAAEQSHRHKEDDPICGITTRAPVDLQKFFESLKTSKLEVIKDGTKDKEFQDTVTVADVIKKNGDKPTIVLSMCAVCPHAIKSEKLYNVLFDAVKDVATPVIVFNGTVEQAREFKNKTSLTSLVLCDPKCLISYEGSPLERSSTSVIFVAGRPAKVSLEVANNALGELTIPCSNKGFQFMIQRSFGTRTNEASATWSTVNQNIGKSLETLSFQFGCPSAPQ